MGSFVSLSPTNSLWTKHSRPLLAVERSDQDYYADARLDDGLDAGTTGELDTATATGTVAKSPGPAILKDHNRTRGPRVGYPNVLGRKDSVNHKLRPIL